MLIWIWTRKSICSDSFIWFFPKSLPVISAIFFSTRHPHDKARGKFNQSDAGCQFILSHFISSWLVFGFYWQGQSPFPTQSWELILFSHSELRCQSNKHNGQLGMNGFAHNKHRPIRFSIGCIFLIFSRAWFFPSFYDAPFARVWFICFQTGKRGTHPNSWAISIRAWRSHRTKNCLKCDYRMSNRDVIVKGNGTPGWFFHERKMVMRYAVTFPALPNSVRK